MSIPNLPRYYSSTEDETTVLEQAKYTYQRTWIFLHTAFAYTYNA